MKRTLKGLVLISWISLKLRDEVFIGGNLVGG